MDDIYDASDRRHIRVAEKQAKVVDDQRGEIVRGIMSLIPGRAWMVDLLEACHVFSSSMATSALQMAFSEGERNIGLRLLNDVMRACPDEYVLMMRERNERDSTNSARRANAERADRIDDASEPDTE